MTNLADVDNEEWNTLCSKTLRAQLFHHRTGRRNKGDSRLSGAGDGSPLTPFTKEKANLITVTAIV